MNLLQRVAAFIILVLGLFLHSQGAVYAQSYPTHVTVYMYALDPLSAAPLTETSLCTPADRRYGCVFEINASKTYPYADNPVTMPIDTHYLLNVVPKESNSEPESIGGSDFHPEAIRAQAIAARTYAWYKISQGDEIDNSTNDQVFIPNVFSRLDMAGNDTSPYYAWGLNEDPCSDANYVDLTETKQEVCNAVRDRLYISAAGIPAPVFSEFSADPDDFATGNYNTTQADGIRQSVADPISRRCFPQVFGHGRGMSQNGASRWARGDTCTSGAVLNPWSVTYQRAEQILVHYYTGIDIRKTGTTAVTTPPLRWNPLQITNLPATFGTTNVAVTLWVQNTGTQDWFCESGIRYRIGYAWAPPLGSSVEPTYTYTNLCSAGSGVRIAKGKDKQITVSVVPPSRAGYYRLIWDMQRVSTISGTYYSSFRNQSPVWPTYTINRCVQSCRLEAPYIANGGSSTTSTTTNPAP